MLGTSEIQAAARARGRVLKRNNAATAILVGGGLAILCGRAFGFHWLGFLVGIPLGLVYANAFEYFFHRFALHAPGGALAQEHAVHHNTWNAPDEAMFVNFATAPWAVALLFAINVVPFAILEWAFHLGLAPGVLLSFVVYFVLEEELHWRFHTGEWVPPWLRSARRHHLLHHAGNAGRYNVFLPLFDWLFAHQEK